MAFRKNKVLQVELKNPNINLVTPQENDQASSSIQNVLWTPELILKTIAFLTVAINGGLSILGYIHLAGYLDTFGVSLNELEIGLPTLLFNGYLSAMIAITDHHIFSAIALIITTTTLLSCGLFIVFRTKQWAKKFISHAMATLLVISIPLIPIFGITAGQRDAYRDYRLENGTPPIISLTNTTTINTKDNKTITGTKIFATIQYTLILQKNELYKILNKGNQIVSISKFTPKLEQQMTSK
ncbi:MULTISPECIES: hypothetical protein [Gammaproteobacteria]|uniref:hypothetical protein n=1 Tax=Gammaproteobacteria TaxID=1236 RepID=UPI001912D2AD|nr:MULTISPECIES: hypothetical protein [Gammaproteobacteria]MBK5299718.1 hypothetical protein [Bacillus sp. TH86]MBK5319487.1 hypothetical protein [Bacillus sp. TH59]MBK5334437.1 hypothetical protein [Bacillus sp. TH57]MBK5308527.1 hypothetical protein [Pseudomonas sp. TH71]MBK5313986.1 hypothetical protein [Erwinia sp. TH79]